MIASLLLLPLLVGGRLDSPVTERAEALGQQALARASEPRGAAPLIRLRGLLDEVDDLNLLAEPVSAVAFRASTHPLVRTLARQFLADVERARGKTLKAQELIRDTGFVQDWWAVGGFDNEGKGGCDKDFGPEAALDLKATYPLKDREVGWRPVGARSVDGLVDLSQLLEPSQEVVAYAFTSLQVEQEQRAVLSVGAPGGYRLFVNGVKVSSSDRYNQARPDQARVQVSLRRGHNRVLLKVCQERGLLGFYLRAEKGEGARGEVKAVLPDAVPALERGGPPRAEAVPTLVELLARAVAARPADAELRSDYATLLAYTRAYDEREHLAAVEARKAADADPKSAELQLRAASLQTEDTNERMLLVERALVADPKSVMARFKKAELVLAREYPDRALPQLTALLADAPHYAPAMVARVRALEALGEKARAAQAAELAFQELPWVPGVAREAVAQSRRLGRLEEAIARAHTVLALRFDDLSTRRALATMLVDAGRVDEAVDQHRKVLALDPFDTTTRLKLGELLAANGKPAESSAVFAEARRLAPDDAEVHEKEGRALLLAGKKDEALLSLQTALRLKPQNSALKDMVRALRGDDSAASPHALDVAALAKAEGATPGEDAVVLAEVNAVRVQTTGLSSRFSQVAVKVLTPRGVDAWRQLPITWSPDRQEVRVVKARLTKPDGSIVESFADQDRALNEPWTGMYYDSRAKVLTFPSLAPGDVLEVQWRVDDTAAENLLSDYWGDVDMVQGLSVKRRYLYVVDMPRGRALHWNAETLPKWVTEETTTEGDRTLYRFRAYDVPRVVPEPQMPGWAEVATPLHLSTYATWEDVGRYYWGLVRDQLTPNDELRAQVDTVLKGVDRKDTARVVAAISGFVVTNTRYVALEFGIHGYKPYRVDRVLARRFGDCKDKASLIHAMLKVAGVDSRLVLLRMRSLGTLAGKPASLSAFNHAIAYVPALDLYLDGTAEFHGSRETPTADRLADVLIIEPDGKSRFLVTPEARPQDNLTTISMDNTLEVGGGAKVKGRVEARGQAAPDFRRTFQTPATRAATFEQQFASAYPGLAASEVTMSDVTALEQPAVLAFTMAVPRMAEASEGALRFFPFGSSRSYTQSLAGLSERKFDVVLPGVWENRFLSTWTLPAGFALGQPVPEVEKVSPFGSFKATVRQDGAKLVCEGTLTLSSPRIAARDYPAFRQWLLEVDQAFATKVEVKKAARPAP